MYNVEFLFDTTGAGVKETVISFKAVSRSCLSIGIRVDDDMADVIFSPGRKWETLLRSELVGETIKS